MPSILIKSGLPDFLTGRFFSHSKRIPVPLIIFPNHHHIRLASFANRWDAPLVVENLRVLFRHIFEIIIAETKHQKAIKAFGVFAQIEKNPKVELCAFKGGQWLRVAGKLVYDPRIEAEDDMLKKNPGLQKMYQPGDGNTAVLYFTEAEATFSSFTAPERKVQF